MEFWRDFRKFAVKSKPKRMRKFLLLFLCLFFFWGTIQMQAQERIKMIRGAGGTYTIPCEVNGLKLTFIFDTGASDVSLSSTEASFMLKNGYISEDDYIGTENYQIANGNVTEGFVFNLKSIKIGNTVIRNVRACVTNETNAPLLLGQSVLSKLGSYTIDGDYLVLNTSYTNSNGNDSGSMAAEINLSDEDFQTIKNKAEQGDVAAQFDLGVCYDNGYAVPQNYEEAAKWYRKAAEQGYADAQNNLGNLYYNGKGVPQSYTESLKWYRMAAEQNDANGQQNLATHYFFGEGVEQNYTEAVKWLRLAAEQGQALAQENLGFCYLNGSGVAQDVTEAVRWYRLAAEQGLAHAQYCLGNFYENGTGVPQSDAEAANWYKLAAEQGNADAQNNLGNFYYNGKGVPQNYEEALKWLRMAARQGQADAKTALDSLGEAY